MSDVVEQQEELQEIDYKAFYESNVNKVKDFDSVVAKKDELLKETKQAKEKERKQTEVAELARKEQKELAEKNGEFEKIAKYEREEKEKALSELMATRKENRDEKIHNAAMKVAIDLAKGDAKKAELLREFLAKSISNVADEFGRVDADTLQSVHKQFEVDERYAPLLGGNLSVGGSAPGNMRSAPQKDKVITRADFETLSQYERGQFFSKGGKLTD